MKNRTIFIEAGRTKVMLLLFTCLSLFAVSCSDDDDDVTADVTASVMVVNSVEGSNPQDFYLDDTKASSSAVAYANASGYMTVVAGSRKAEFKTAGTATVNASSTESFQAGKSYTVYYSGTTSAATNFKVEDDLSTVAGKAKVRFVHLSSAAASTIDLGATATSKLVTNLAYKTASNYYNVDAGTNFQLFASGSATPSLNLPNLGLQAEKVYTIFISGSTTATIKYTVVVNK